MNAQFQGANWPSVNPRALDAGADGAPRPWSSKLIYLGEAVALGAEGRHDLRRTEHRGRGVQANDAIVRCRGFITALMSRRRPDQSRSSRHSATGSSPTASRLYA